MIHIMITDDQFVPLEATNLYVTFGVNERDGMDDK